VPPSPYALSAVSSQRGSVVAPREASCSTMWSTGGRTREFRAILGSGSDSQLTRITAPREPMAADVMRKLVTTLGFLHSQGIVHR